MCASVCVPVWVCSCYLTAATLYKLIPFIFKSLMDLHLDGFGRPYSAIPIPWSSQLEIQHFSFMNLLPKGFGRHWSIFHDSDLPPPLKPIRNPTLFLFEFAPEWLWQALAHIFKYYSNSSIQLYYIYIYIYAVFLCKVLCNHAVAHMPCCRWGRGGGEVRGREEIPGGRELPKFNEKTVHLCSTVNKKR